MASTVWRGYITFGLISIPVRLFRAARAERISFRRMVRSTSAKTAVPLDTPDADDETEEDLPPARFRTAKLPVAEVRSHAEPSSELQPLRQVSVMPSSQTPVEAAQIVHGYEFEPDRYVAIDKEELKNLAPKTATEMGIEEFVQLSEIDPVFFETSYYLVPEQAGQKAYGLLYQALQDAKLVALAQFAMHNREHVVVIRPGKRGLIAHTMFYLNEVRADEEYQADTSSVSEKELGLARKLVESLSGPFEPAKYRDTYREKVEALIASKVAGEPVQKEAAPTKTATVVDITEALQKSLAALRKPPASAAPDAAAPAHRTASKKRAKAGGHS